MMADLDEAKRVLTGHATVGCQRTSITQLGVVGGHCLSNVLGVGAITSS